MASETMEHYIHNEVRDVLYSSNAWRYDSAGQKGRDNASYIEDGGKRNSALFFAASIDSKAVENEMKIKYGRSYARANSEIKVNASQIKIEDVIKAKTALGSMGGIENSEEIKWKNMLFHFTQNTSIHGVNRITEKTRLRGRRIIWLLLVLLGMVACVYQVAERTHYFLSNPVSVNARVIYNNSLRFPAITFCNQNVFRLSVAYRRGYYDTLNAMFSKKGSFNMSEFNASELVLYELYNELRHKKEHFVISCRWNNEECEEDDLTSIMTNHGSCLTFNGGNRSKDILTVSHTGADRGLHLQLNVEQYEYMSGPHDAAGLKILIHHQDEIPFVRDLGEAIPTGVSAFVAIKTKAVKNLRKPHGSCNDSRRLASHDFYSSSACKSECIAEYARKLCGCRDIYMSGSGENAFYSLNTSRDVPYCNLKQYTDCIVPAIDISNAIDDQCECPVPCYKEYYMSTVTYSSASSISTSELYVSNLTNTLSGAYKNASEIRQRVDPYTIYTDNKNINEIHQKWERLVSLLQQLMETIIKAEAQFDELESEIRGRVFWHRVWGIEKIKMAIDRNFARGWEVMDERTFVHVTTQFYQQSSLYKRMVAESLAYPNDTNLRLVHYITTDRELQYRAELSERALANYTTLHKAITTVSPIYNFRLTTMRHAFEFDRQYSKNLDEFLQAETEGKYFERIHTYYLDYLKHIARLRDAAKGLYENGTIDEESYLSSLSWFEQRCRNFNYYRYMYRENVIFKAQSTVQDRVNTFIALNQTMHAHIDELRLAIYNSKTLLKEFDAHFVYNLSRVIQQARDYLTTATAFKLPLAKSFTSEKMQEIVSDSEVFLKDMRTRGQQVDDAWQRFRVSYERIWSTIVGETSLKHVYDNIRNITKKCFSPNQTEYKEEFYGHVAPMLNINITELMAFPEEVMVKKMNADTLTLTQNDITNILDKRFAGALATKGVLAKVTTASDSFTSTMVRMQEDMAKYIASTTIDRNFYRENFLQLNIYMSEMNYQELTQQIAYDEFGLISDVGGAMGLFIGASFLTVFEFVDVIVSTFIQKYFVRNTERC